MPVFRFSSSSELIAVLNFLVSFDASVRFHYGLQPHGNNSFDSLLSLSLTRVPPFCFTQVQFLNTCWSQSENDGSESTFWSSAEETVSWVVNGVVMLGVLRGLHADAPFTLQVPHTSSCLRLLQEEEGRYSHVFQIDALYDLGPKLELDETDLTYYPIADISGFRQITKSLSTCAPEFASMYLVWESEGETTVCSLSIASDSITASLRLGHGERPAEELRGKLRCQDVAIFGSLLTEQRPDCKLYVGFGNDGLGALRLQWNSFLGENSVDLYFCAGSTTGDIAPVMESVSLDSQLAENHAILVRHRSGLPPEKLLHHLQGLYGKILSHVTLEMQTSTDLLTAIFFADSREGENCFLDLRHIADHAQEQQMQSEAGASPSPAHVTTTRTAIVNVGWIHKESFWATFQSKPYIKRRVSSPSSPVAEPSTALKSQQGYLIIFWKEASTFQRMELELWGKEQGAACWTDEKEGGRLFLTFVSVDDALSFRDRVVGKYPFLSRCVSFAEEEDFQRAGAFSNPHSKRF